MLFYISLYVLAAVLMFQGSQILGELGGNHLSVVPEEVAPAPTPAARWGGFLITYGAAMALTGILSHLSGWFEGSLSLMRGFGVVVEALYGIWLVFGRKVDYTPAPSQEAPAHH